MTVRAATPGDEQVLARLNAFVQTLHLAKRPHDFKAVLMDEVEAWFRARLRNATTRIWIADVEGGQAAGYALAKMQARAENVFCPARRWCELDQIAVNPKFRRRGVARALVQAAVAAAAHEGIRDLEMNTWSFNKRAQSAFRKLGFSPKGVRWELRGGSR